MMVYVDMIAALFNFVLFAVMIYILTKSWISKYFHDRAADISRDVILAEDNLMKATSRLKLARKLRNSLDEDSQGLKIALTTIADEAGHDIVEKSKISADNILEHASEHGYNIKLIANMRAKNIVAENVVNHAKVISKEKIRNLGIAKNLAIKAAKNSGKSFGELK